MKFTLTEHSLRLNTHRKYGVRVYNWFYWMDGGFNGSGWAYWKEGVRSIGGYDWESVFK